MSSDIDGSGSSCSTTEMYSLSDKSKLTDFRCVVDCVEVVVDVVAVAVDGVVDCDFGLVFVSYFFGSLSNTSISMAALSVISVYRIECGDGDGGRGGGGGFFAIEVIVPTDDRLSFDDCVTSN